MMCKQDTCDSVSLNTGDEAWSAARVIHRDRRARQGNLLRRDILARYSSGSREPNAILLLQSGASEQLADPSRYQRTGFSGASIHRHYAKSHVEQVEYSIPMNHWKIQDCHLLRQRLLGEVACYECIHPLGRSKYGISGAKHSLHRIAQQETKLQTDIFSSAHYPVSQSHLPAAKKGKITNPPYCF